MTPEVTATHDIYEKAEKILEKVDLAGKELRLRTNPFDYEYHQLMARILRDGSTSEDRTGTGTIKVPGGSVQFDISSSFPLLTSKYTRFKGIKEELLWFVKGGRNIRPLIEAGVNIWNEWAYQWYLKQNGIQGKFPTYSEQWRGEMEQFVEKIKSDPEFAELWGDIGPVYGWQWRHWKTPEGGEVDQLQKAIETLTKNPGSRRIIVSAWNAADIEELAARSLPPCHTLYQFIVTADRTTGESRLNCVMFQRSCDVFLGLPFNIGSYAALTYMVAHLTGLRPGILRIYLGDTHLYLNHLDQVGKQLANASFAPPTLKLDTHGESTRNIEDFRSEHFVLEGYRHAERISAPISV